MKQPLILTAIMGCVCLITGCQPTNQANPAKDASSASHAKPTDKTLATSKSTQSNQPVLPSVSSAVTSTQVASSTINATKQIDWTLIDSGIKPKDKRRFNYPFELDSEPVKAYADVYHVDKETSRYNLTVGMAVNEVLAKVLDQIGTQYTYHELTAGKDSTFIIHTTEQIAPSEHIYVFAEPFAEGLTIPVKIVNDGKK